MKGNLKYLGLAVTAGLISIIGILLLNLLWEPANVAPFKEIVSDVLIGLFASSLLSIPTSIIGFCNEENRIKENVRLRLSIIRMKVKDILCNSTTVRCADACLIDIEINDAFKDNLTDINADVIALCSQLAEIPQVSSIKKLKKEALEFCDKFNKLTERVMNRKGQSGEKISDKEIHDALDITKLNKMLDLSAPKFN